MIRLILIAVLLICFETGLANPHSPEGPTRSYAQNYQDMILASCIARAYKNDSIAGKDANYSASVFVDWTLYDVEKSSEAIDQLINRFLARDYHNPLVEYQGIQFNLLKCMDLYHSRELADQVKKFVPNPRHTFKQDYPPSSIKTPLLWHVFFTWT